MSATSVGVGAIGGMIGALVFRMEDAPHYYPGNVICIGAAILSTIVVVLLDWTFTRANQRATRGGKVIAGLEGFRYTLSLLLSCPTSVRNE